MYCTTNNTCYIFFFLFLVDYRVRPLVMLVKKWAKKHDINDASHGTLSSYALTLMVIHYLQGKIIGSGRVYHYMN